MLFVHSARMFLRCPLQPGIPGRLLNILMFGVIEEAA